MGDVTGRKQLTRNVVVAWGMQLFVLVVGFLVPRKINDSLGADLLGIWDLGWATVNYLSVMNLGVGTAVMRYGSKYRAQGDIESFSKVYTASTVWQLAVSVLTGLVATIFAFTVHLWIEIPATISLIHAELALLMLGLSLSVNVLSNSAAGVLAAHHRWDVTQSINAINATAQGIAVLGVLILGGGLVWMAASVLTIATCTTATRFIFATILVKDVRIAAKYWDAKVAFSMLSFGSKTVVGLIPQIILFQSTAMLLTAFAGPAALAMYNRGVALVRQVSSAVKRVAIMFLPISGSLVGLDRKEEAVDLIVQSGRYGAAVTIPLAVMFICFGDLILLLWMGEGYDNQLMISLLAIGMCLASSMSPVYSVLAGLNAHGKISIYNFFLSVVALVVVATVISIYFTWNMNSAAALVAICWPIGNGIVIPLYVQHRFNISVFTFASKTLIIALLCSTPAIVLFPVGRYFYVCNGSFLLLVSSVVLAGLIQAVFYYKWILSDFGREQARKIFFSLLKKSGLNKVRRS
ncbi:hypothetical protein NBRC116495_04750 [Aurantivibrio plasticivorans]